MKVTSFFSIPLSLLSAALICGCSWRDYGKTETQPRTVGTLVLQELMKNWQDFHIYSEGVKLTRSVALLFDPKSDNRRVVVPEKSLWVKVEDGRVLSEIISWINASSPRTQSFQRVLGSDGKLYCYLYLISGAYRAIPKEIGDRTLHVSIVRTDFDRFQFEYGPPH